MITYILLCGYPPFYGNTDRDIFNSVRIGKYDFPSPEWDTVSDAAREFVDRLLKLDPSERATAGEVRRIISLVITVFYYTLCFVLFRFCFFFSFFF